MDLWRIRPAGGEIERLTFHEARVSHPTLLDDRTLVYIAPAEDGSGPSLYGIDVDERTPHRISFGIERYTSIAASADGRRLVATLSAPEASLWRVPISDRPIEAAGPTRLPVRALSPRLGSDYLVYLKDDGKAIWKLEGDRASELWTGEGRVPAPPAVSPNGERIAFTVRRGEHTRLYAMNADGTAVRPLIEAHEVRGGIAWSPDSEAIVVGVDQGNGPQLWRIALADAEPRVLTTEYAVDPVWSPDGSFLVYSGSQLGPGFPVKAIRLDGAGAPISPLSLLRNDRFRFLPGGGALVLLKREGAQSDFWRFDLETGSERRLTDFGPEYSIQDFDVSSDGKEIVFDRLKQASDIVLIDLPPR